MSFWDNNKDSFKAAGIATAKGIGRGTKALGKGGYQMYKNRNGGSSTSGSGNSTNQEGVAEGDAGLPVAALPPKPTPDQLKTLPAPPQRNVGAAPPGQGAYPAPAAQPQYNPNYQQQQQYQQPQQQFQQPYQQQPYQQQGQQQFQQQPQQFQQQPQPQQFQQQPQQQFQQQPQQQFQQQPQQQPQQQQFQQQPQQQFQQQPQQFQQQAQPLQQPPQYQPQQFQPQYQQTQQTQPPPEFPQQVQPSQQQQGYGQTAPIQPAASDQQQQPQQSFQQQLQNSLSQAISQGVSNGVQVAAHQAVQQTFHPNSSQTSQANPQEQQPPQQQQPQQQQFPQQFQPQFPAQSSQAQVNSVGGAQQPTPPARNAPAATPFPPAASVSNDSITYESPYHNPQYGQPTQGQVPLMQPIQPSNPASDFPTQQPFYAQTQPQPAPVAEETRPKYNFGVRVESNEEEIQKPKTPLPDPTSFAPPPIHKNRGSSEPTPEPGPPKYSPYSSSSSVKPKVSTTSSATASATTSTKSDPPALPSKTNYLDIDLSKVGPPPPKIFRGPVDELTHSKPFNKPPTPTRAGPIPSLPPRNSVVNDVPSPALSSTPKAEIKPTSSFLPPPKLYRGPGEQILVKESKQNKDTHKGPPPKPRKLSSKQDDDEEDVSAPVKPSRPTEEEEAPPMPNRSHEAAVALSTKKAPPPKPSKKPSSFDSEHPPPPYSIEDQHQQTSSSSSTTTSTPTHSGQPNFAAQIAARFSETTLADEPIETKPKKVAPPIKKKPVHDTIEAEVTDFRSILNNQLKKADTNGSKPVFPRAKPELPHKYSGEVPTLKAKPEVPHKPKPEVKAKPEIGQIHKPPLANKPPKPEIQKTPEIAVPPPPPARNYIRSPASIPAPVAVPIQTGPPNFNLELQSGWFANLSGPLTLPKDLAGLNYSTSIQYSSSGSTTNYERGVNLRLKDLSILKYKITWSSDNVNNPKVDVTEYIPSPITNKVPTKAELITYHEKYGEYIGGWCEHHYGQQVGSGECWDLARDALLKGCGKHAFVSQYYHHGFPILEIEGVNGGVALSVGTTQLDEVRRGDILQFKSCRFENKPTGRTQHVGAPDHTSVVLANNDGKIKVAEQNVNGVRTVMDGEYILKDLVEGKLTVYRPIDAAWAGQF